MAAFMIALIIDYLVTRSILDRLGKIQILLAAIEAWTTFGRRLSKNLYHLLRRQISQAFFACYGLGRNWRGHIMLRMKPTRSLACKRLFWLENYYGLLYLLIPLVFIVILVISWVKLMVPFIFLLEAV